MCGLCGVYGHVDQEAKEVFATLQHFSQMRGQDSTGVAVIGNQKGKYALLNTVGNVTFWQIEFEKYISNLKRGVLLATDINCLMGHHRAATSGKVTEENTHPFDFEHTIGCHNGTVMTHKMRDFKSHDYKKIDSQILLEEIDSTYKKEAKDTPVSLLEKVPGAWALVWADKKTKELHMARNGERTLYVAFAEDKKTMYWASEVWMLQTALNRSRVDWNKTVYYIEKQQHVTYHVNKKTRAVEMKSNLSISECKEEAWSYYTQYGSQYYKRPSSNNNKVTEIFKRKGTSLTPPPDTEKNKGKVQPKEPEFLELYTTTSPNTFVHKTYWEQLVSEGCVNCKSKLEWKDREEIFWDGPDNPHCEVCSKHLEEQATQARKVH